MKWTILTAAVLLTGLSSSLLAQEQLDDPNAGIDVYSMHETCQTDPAYQGRCFTLPASYAPSITLREYAEASAKPHGGDPQILIDAVIHFNGWYGATGDLVIPAGVAFRTA